MFDSLDEKMKCDDRATTTPRERWLLYAVVLVTSIVLFGGLYAGIRFLG
jgi:hypothetical protein